MIDDDYTIYRKMGLLHDECDPVWHCCDECLINLGFDIDTNTPPVTLEDVKEMVDMDEEQWRKKEDKEE